MHARAALVALLLTMGLNHAWGEDLNERAGPSLKDFPVDFLVYSVTWQPSFCLMNPKMPGCNSPPNAFLSHGIWPYSKSEGGASPITNRHPQFCEAPSGCTGKACVISDEEMNEIMTIPRLAKLVTSNPEGMFRHEWRKHGTCYGGTIKDYFSDLVSLRKVVSYDKEKLSKLIGTEASFTVIKDAFPKNTAFRCYQSEGKQYLHEVFYLIDRTGNPYILESPLQIGIACNKVPTLMPPGAPVDL
ncbi:MULTISPECIES: ribonuclease T2 family protein [Pseudomonas]|jgi:ribonuclease T2|uniref:Ribonuclease n=1 Tax=Pseudomonas soli TaxID=1306993 RepID=A0A2V4HQZ2_9PSED|nr:MULTISPECIES: ribonuclease [Pseudomonas]PYB73570.1 ribonuclease [Pseudomonas soli]PZW72992.1 ribonuclease T2 [Pseudomonas sp. 2848]